MSTSTSDRLRERSSGLSPAAAWKRGHLPPGVSGAPGEQQDAREGRFRPDRVGHTEVVRYDVREATGDDIPGIVAAYVRSWRGAYEGFLDPDGLAEQAELRRDFQWHRGIESPITYVAVAVQGDHVLGVVEADEVLPPPRDLPEITMLYVDPAVWGTGVSAQLLSAGVDWIASRGHRDARLRVVEEHWRARRFYEDEGWAPDPELEPVQTELARLIYYRRRLESRDNENGLA